jgi:hypothetical protein
MVSVNSHSDTNIDEVERTDILTSLSLSLGFLGTWTVFNPADLKDIIFTPPPYWSGNLTLALTGIVMELANGDQVTQSVNFTVYIKPVASDFEILTNDITLGATGIANLSLNLVLLDQRGTDLGETPQEIITLNFTNVPPSSFLHATRGGRLENPEPGKWMFTGTQSQAEGALQIVGVNQSAGFFFVSVDGVTRDGADVLAAPTTDDFDFKVTVNSLTTGASLVAANQANIVLTGTASNDILRATGFTNQALIGGAGMDLLYSSSSGTIMTGGTGSDQFVFLSFPPANNANTVTDFTAQNGADVLNVGALVDKNFNLQLGNVAQVVRIVPEASGTKLVQVYDGTIWRDVVRLTISAGTADDVQTLWSNGNLLI